MSFLQLCSDLFASQLDSAQIRQLCHTWQLFVVISPQWTINTFSTNDMHFNNSCLASVATISYVRLQHLYHNDQLGICITGYDRLSIYIGISMDSVSVYKVLTSMKTVMQSCLYWDSSDHKAYIMIFLANVMVTLYVHASIYTTIKEYSRIGNY